MALVVKDRVQETSTTTGTGSLTLLGAVTGFQTFSSAIGNTNTTYYTIQNGAEWEVGVGTVSAGALSRDTVLESSNSGSLVNFSAGTKFVFCTYPAEKSVDIETAQTLTNKTISGASNTLSNIGNSSLTNSAITINGTSTSLGGSINVGTVTSVSGTGSYGGLSLSGTVTGSGNITLGGTPTGTWPISITGESTSCSGNATGSTFGFNSGYGSVATAYGCRAWVNFNGTGTVAIRGSGGVTSITDNGTGQYTVNFSFTMPDSNYNVTTAVIDGAATGTADCIIEGTSISGTPTTMSTTAVKVRVRSSGSATLDCSIVNVSVFR